MRTLALVLSLLWAQAASAASLTPTRAEVARIAGATGPLHEKSKTRELFADGRGNGYVARSSTWRASKVAFTASHRAVIAGGRVVGGASTRSGRRILELELTDGARPDRPSISLGDLEAFMEEQTPASTSSSKVPIWALMESRSK